MKNHEQPSNEVSFLDMNLVQVVSVDTSRIPWIENNDAKISGMEGFNMNGEGIDQFSDRQAVNGNFKILKWRYLPYKAILSGDIPLFSPYIGLICASYLQ